MATETLETPAQDASVALAFAIPQELWDGLRSAYCAEKDDVRDDIVRKARQEKVSPEEMYARLIFKSSILMNADWAEAVRNKTYARAIPLHMAQYRMTEEATLAHFGFGEGMTLSRLNRENKEKSSRRISVKDVL